MAIIGTITYRRTTDPDNGNRPCIIPVPDRHDDDESKLVAQKTGSGLRYIELVNDAGPVIDLTFEIQECSKDAFVGKQGQFSVKPGQPVLLRLRRHIGLEQDSQGNWISRSLAWDLKSSSHNTPMCGHEDCETGIKTYHTEVEVEC